MLALDANRTRSGHQILSREPASLNLVTRTQWNWPGGGCPHFASIVLGRVAHVSDETSDTNFGKGVAAERDGDGLDPETADTLAEAERAMQETRERLAETPAEVIVTNHVMGLYELAAIHLSASPPDLHQSALAIDAVACLVDGLGERLGDDHATMQDALNNIRLAFVQIKGQITASES